MATGCAAFAQASSAIADDDWKDWAIAEPWRISLGFFIPNLDTTVQVSGVGGNVGTRISFERNLGLDDNKTTGILDVGWRFARRHRLTCNVFELDRSASTPASNVTIIIADTEFDVSLPIESFLDISANELAYSYSVLLDEKKDLSLGIGVSLQDVAAGIRGTALDPNPGTIINFDLDSSAPLPTLNIGFRYAFNDKWIFQSKLGWLAVEASLRDDEILKGSIINAHAGVRWRAFDNVGFFARYQLFDVDADWSERRLIYNINYDYHGPLIGVVASF